MLTAGCRTAAVTALACSLFAGCRSTTETGRPPPASSVTTSTPASAGASAIVDGAPVNSGGVPLEVQPQRPGPLNVVLLTIDSLRADMPWLGYPRAIAPNLTKLAREGVLYTRAYSVSSYTAKSIPALLAGRYPSQLYRNWSFFAEYSLENQFFPELLQASGIRTLGGHAHFYFDHGKNLNQGFDVWRMVPGIKVNNTTDESVTGDKTTDLAIDMLRESKNTEGPFFMWLHYMDPHDQYRPHPESPKFGKENRDRYDSEVFYTDLQIERLLAFARQQPWWGRTAVIVSADHGEAFGEHKMYRHAFALWEVLTRVPLFIFGPGITAKTIDARRSDIDLAPTIVDLLGVAPSPGFVGKSLVPEVYGLESPQDREPILTDLPADSNNPPTRALVKGNLKLIVDGEAARLSLYDLELDPGELKNLARDKKYAPELARMKQLFDESWAKLPRVVPYGGGKLVGGGTANGSKGPRPSPDAQKSTKG